MPNEKLLSDKTVILGGILLGDSFRLNSYIEKISKGEPLVAFSSNYNSEVIDLFLKDTDLPIFQNIVLPKSKMVQFHWGDFEKFCEEFKESEYANRFSEVFYPTIEDLHHPLTIFNYNAPDFDIVLPDEFIACQPTTLFAFKNLPEIFKVRFPFPVVNLGGANDFHHIAGSQVENGRSLRETAYIISKSKLTVGIDSCLSQAAAQISQPSIKIHFGSWEALHRSIRETKNGIDLYLPSTKKIEDTIKKALDLISIDDQDLSKLSSVPEETG